MNIWSVLGISETKDKEAIMQAYRNRLPQHHPEDDPEGFKRLRQAYEEALAACDAAEKTQAARPDLSPVEAWIARAAEIYADFFKRREPSSWEELLEDPLCHALGTKQEISEELLKFLMDHFRLSPEVFALLSRHFGWEENREELYDRFPSDFLNYIFNMIYNGSYFRQDYFEGDPHADYDEYLALANPLIDILNEGDREKAQEYLDRMDALEIFHPYGELERIRCFKERGEREKAEELSAKLLASYPEDVHMMTVRAAMLWESGDREDQAMELYRKVAEVVPDYLTPKLREIEYSLHQGRFVEAKEKYYRLLKNYYYECMREFSYEKVLQPIVDKINALLVPYLEQKLEEGEITGKERIDLGWCYYENREEEKAASFLDSFEPSEEYLSKYRKLRGLVAYFQQRFAEAIEDLEFWTKNKILELESEDFALDEDTKEPLSEQEISRKRNSFEIDISKVLQMISHAHSALGNSEAAMQRIQIAIEYNQSDLNMYMTYLFFLSAAKQETEIIRITTEAMEKNGVIEELLLERAISLMKMGNYRDAYADCEEILAMDNPMYSAYLKKLDILEYWGFYEDHAETLKEVKEVYPDEKMTRLYELKQLRLEKEDSLSEVEKLLESALKDREYYSDMDIAEIYYELYHCCMTQEEDPAMLERAGEYLDEAIARHPNHIEYIVTRGALFERDQSEEGYEKAEKLYQETLDKFPCQMDMLLCLGAMNYNRGRYEEALRFYQPIVERYPKYNIYVYNFIADCHKKMGRFDEAIEKLSEKIGLEQTPANLLERGTTRMECLCLEEARQDLEHAAEMSPDDFQIYCVLGMLHVLKNELDSAEEYFRQSIRLFEDPYHGYNPFYHGMRCFFMNGHYEDCIETGKLAAEKFDDPVWVMEWTVKALVRLGRHQEAIDYMKENLKRAREDGQEIEETILLAEIYALLGRDDEAERLVLQKLEKYKGSMYMTRKAAVFYDYALNKPELALKCYEKISEAYQEDYYIMLNTCSCIWRILRAKQPKKKLLFFGGGKDHKLSQDKEIRFLRMRELEEAYTKYENPFIRGCRTAEVAASYLYVGRWEEAEERAAKALELPACTSCISQEPGEAYYILGLVAEHRGEKEKAAEYLEKAVRLSYCNRLYEDELRRVKSGRPSF